MIAIQGLIGVTICGISFAMGVYCSNRALVSKNESDQDRWGMRVVGCAVLFWVGVAIWVTAFIFWSVS